MLADFNGAGDECKKASHTRQRSATTFHDGHFKQYRNSYIPMISTTACESVDSLGKKTNWLKSTWHKTDTGKVSEVGTFEPNANENLRIAYIACNNPQTIRVKEDLTHDEHLYK